MALTELKGTETGHAEGRASSAARCGCSPGAAGRRRRSTTATTRPVPPTFPFVMPFWGSLGTGRRGRACRSRSCAGPGRAILHGEQAFEYHRWPQVGDVLEGTTVVTDVYEKERSNGGKLEFYVTETEWKDAETGDPVVHERSSRSSINVRPPEGRRTERRGRRCSTTWGTASPTSSDRAASTWTSSGSSPGARSTLPTRRPTQLLRPRSRRSG